MFSRVQKLEKDPKSIGFNELVDMKQAIDREIASRKDTEIEALKSRATAAASALGIPLGELFGIQVPVVTPPAPEPRKTRRPQKVRYRDPEDATNVWTGRGRPPTWLQDKRKRASRPTWTWSQAGFLT